MRLNTITKITSTTWHFLPLDIQPNTIISPTILQSSTVIAKTIKKSTCNFRIGPCIPNNFAERTNKTHDSARRPMPPLSGSMDHLSTWWRQKVPLKRWYVFTRPCGVATHETAISEVLLSNLHKEELRNFNSLPKEGSKSRRMRCVWRAYKSVFANSE